MADTPPKIVVEDSPPAKRGPGRPKGSTNKATTPIAADTRDVKKALATLNGAYNLIATGMMALGLTETAKAWAETAEDLNKTNADALQAAPKLARMIAAGGSVGGAGTFLVTHFMAVASISTLARKEYLDRKAEKLLNDTPVPDDTAGL